MYRRPLCFAIFAVDFLDPSAMVRGHPRTQSAKHRQPFVYHFHLVANF